MLAQTLASWGSTLQASDPDCIVKAMVVRSMAPAWFETLGMTAFSSGSNSQKFEKSIRMPKPA